MLTDVKSQHPASPEDGWRGKWKHILRWQNTPVHLLTAFFLFPLPTTSNFRTLMLICLKHLLPATLFSKWNEALWCRTERCNHRGGFCFVRKLSNSRAPSLTHRALSHLTVDLVFNMQTLENQSHFISLLSYYSPSLNSFILSICSFHRFSLYDFSPQRSQPVWNKIGTNAEEATGEPQQGTRETTQLNPVRKDVSTCTSKWFPATTSLFAQRIRKDSDRNNLCTAVRSYSCWTLVLWS